MLFTKRLISTGGDVYMIIKLNITEPHIAAEIYNLQKKAYEVEGNIIGYLDLPPLKETVQDLQQCGELFLGK